jgi:hypothetical protein
MTTIDDVLENFGIKGMRWGVRRSRGADGRVSSGPEPVTLKTNQYGQVKKATGGKRFPASDDAKQAITLARAAKSSGTQALSNDELRTVVNRMQLEQQYSQLTTKQRSAGKAFAAEILKDVGKEETKRVAKYAVAQKVNSTLGIKTGKEKKD